MKKTFFLIAVLMGMANIAAQAQSVNETDSNANRSVCCGSIIIQKGVRTVNTQQLTMKALKDGAAEMKKKEEEASPYKPIYMRTGPAPVNTQAIATKYYPNKMPFFCRQEANIEKKLKVPLLLRVGSVSDCNYLEQKPGFQMR